MTARRKCFPGRTAAEYIRAAWGNQRGTSLIEFSFAASILFMLAIGIILMSLALYSYNVVSESAREGARYAIVRGSSCHFASACPASSANIQTYVKNLAFPGVNPANLTAAASWAAYGSSTCSPSASCNNPGNQVTVTVSYSLPITIPFTSGRTLSMSSTAAMVISQ